MSLSNSAQEVDDSIDSLLLSILSEANLCSNLPSVQEVLIGYKTSPLQFRPSASSNLIELPLDTDALVVLRRCEPRYRMWRPLKVVADGNCLFNAFALFLHGSHSPELSTQLRVAVATELVFNVEFYKMIRKDYSMTNEHNTSILMKEFNDELKSVCNEGDWCGYLSLAAIASVLRHFVRLVYPLVKGTDTPPFPLSYSQVLNHTFTPRNGECYRETIYILASGNVEKLEKNPIEWTCNHFVLLIDPNVSAMPASPSNH